MNSDWSDLIPVDIEAEYSRIYKKGPNKSCVTLLYLLCQIQVVWFYPLPRLHHAKQL